MSSSLFVLKKDRQKQRCYPCRSLQSSSLHDSPILLHYASLSNCSMNNCKNVVIYHAKEYSIHFPTAFCLFLCYPDCLLIPFTIFHAFLSPIFIHINISLGYIYTLNLVLIVINSYNLVYLSKFVVCS